MSNFMPIGGTGIRTDACWNSGSHDSDPIGALAHLQLGRASVLAGDKAKAKAAYDDFFTLWKEADPDVPILKRAHAEYLALD